jgi:hypothetical protein
VADAAVDEAVSSHEVEADTLVAGADTLAAVTKVDLSVALRAAWAVTPVPWAQGQTWVEWACREWCVSRSTVHWGFQTDECGISAMMNPMMMNPAMMAQMMSAMQGGGGMGGAGGAAGQGKLSSVARHSQADISDAAGNTDEFGRALKRSRQD